MSIATITIKAHLYSILLNLIEAKCNVSLGVLAMRTLGVQLGGGGRGREGGGGGENQARVLSLNREAFTT